ncbi:MAG: hypothetical protein ABID87_09250 [Chloroflexota bacterium]
MAKRAPVRTAHFKLPPAALLLLPFLLLSLSPLSPPGHPAEGATEAVKWHRVSIPAGGNSGDWVLAPGSEITQLHLAEDGAIFAGASGLEHTLYRSTDGGNRWDYLGNVSGEITGIATAPGGDYAIYHATPSGVFRSTDGGKSFQELPASPGGAGSNNIEITSLTVTRTSHNLIAVGTRDTDAGQFGGVYLLNESEAVPAWADTSLDYDVYAVAFSPGYAADRQLLAVATDETDTYAAARTADAAWDTTFGNARLDKDNSGTPAPVAVTDSAAIAFSGDYAANAAEGVNTFFIGIDTGSGDGDVYRIELSETPGASLATDLNAGVDYGWQNLDIAGLAAFGEEELLAGAADSARTLFSTDSGKSWTRSRKEPTGSGQTRVLLPAEGTSYAATSGSGSAFSISRDRGTTWNQSGLIDTAMDALLHLAPSPHYEEDSTLFLLTFGNGAESLWRTADGGGSWERIFAAGLANVDSLSLVALSPQYGPDSRVLFLAGVSNSRPAVWKSTDDGVNFNRRLALDPDDGTLLNIDTWAVVDNDTLFLGTFDGSNGKIYRTENSGFFYSRGAKVGNQSLSAIVLSPDYRLDQTLLVSNSHGWVHWSEDGGSSFTPLPADAATAPLTGIISVATDPDFARNRTVYAASRTSNAGISRFVIGSSNEWESIDGNLPAGSTLEQVVVSTAGTLYAANSQDDAGMERSLNPAYSLGPTFESVARGLSDGATLTGLWQYGNRLWAMDTTHNWLVTFVDSLTGPCLPNTPESHTLGLGAVTDHVIRNARLDWDTLPDATSYQWQLDYDTDFSSVPSGFEGTTKATSVRLPNLTPDTTYYWRVRACEPVLSPWSEKWSFTTSLETTPIDLKLESPAPGATDVPANPVFQWNAVAGADAYELLVATDIGFSSPSVIRAGNYALGNTAWQCEVDLKPETTYYWKVRAVTNENPSAWSASGAFTTASSPLPVVPASPLPETGPLPPPAVTNHASPEIITPQNLPGQERPLLPPPPPNPPPMPLAPAAPGTQIIEATVPVWIVYIIGGLLAAIILLLALALLLVLNIRRF